MVNFIPVKKKKKNATDRNTQADVQATANEAANPVALILQAAAVDETGQDNAAAVDLTEDDAVE